MSAEFVHLHNHSDYSLLDGAQRIPTLVSTVQDLGMDAVAVTEHGNLFSVIPFYQTARKAGIKPIIGCEVYVAQGSRFDKKRTAEGGRGTNHLILLAQNYTGYKNLMKLVTHGYLEGFYYSPRVDKELLRRYNEGLICLSACLKGEVPEWLLRNDPDAARRAALELAEIFPGRFYLEIQNHNIPEEAVNIDRITKLARELDLPLVATNDAHYARQEHWEAHDIHICLGTGKDRSDPNRLRYATPQFYFKSQDEMYHLFREFPQALENTRRIADSIDLDIPMGHIHLPRFPIPDDFPEKNPDAYLRSLCEQGLKKRYPEETPEIKQRLDYELSVIKKMGFAGYFLITSDFVHYAKEHAIPVGPGRGSAAGSLVSYVLGITDIDPLKHGLLFERFLNPDRISMPDIDIDFCINRREEVINYIKGVYGENSVTQIITFGTMKARAVVRDVGRVMGYSFGEVDRIAKAIPAELKITLDKAMEKNPEFRQMAEGKYKELIQHARVLEGMNRHASTHAAGVLIVPGDLTDYIPLYKSPQTDDVVSQYDMKGLEALGLLKMDFLGLRNLTVIDQAVKLIARKGETIDIGSIPLDDPQVYDLFGKGLTIGVFQFESSGMREYLKKLKPTQIEDLIAMNALYRPGPMENIEDFIARKQGRKKIEYPHPALEPILRETYGIIVYQEQVMQIANRIAGFTMAEADSLRKAMGKKIREKMEEMLAKFKASAVEQGISRKKADEIAALIEKFAQYGFNKSHATAYAYVAYQTAWLKTHYPAEFMAANLSTEMSDLDRVVILINECRKLGIRVDPPDVNVSVADFHPVDDHTISFGLNAIKNVGSKALKAILAEREANGPFRTLYEFCERVDLSVVNKKVIESLVLAGAMDRLEGSRAQKFAAVEEALRYGQQIQQRKAADQVDLFASGDLAPVHKTPQLPQVPDWTESEALDRERQVVGMYISGHPLLKYAEDLEEFSTIDFTDSTRLKGEEHVRLGGMITNLRIQFDRRNQPMAFFNLDCLGGQADVVMFASVYDRYHHLVENDRVVFIVGKTSDSSNFSDLKLIADEVVGLENVREYFSTCLHIRFREDEVTPEELEALRQRAERYRGTCKLTFHLKTRQNEQRIIHAHNIRVSSDREFIGWLRDRFGKSNVWIE
ncbi:MAG: DNA polymerase III subunit alpha [Candidatus Neomarinimicrobiota bacterium]|nr:MAG: DNA polymerase III subunit alpha [Candidatus Neomarinimicrobiota bacterium]